MKLIKQYLSCPAVNATQAKPNECKTFVIGSPKILIFCFFFQHEAKGNVYRVEKMAMKWEGLLFCFLFFISLWLFVKRFFYSKNGYLEISFIQQTMAMVVIDLIDKLIRSARRTVTFLVLASFHSTHKVLASLRNFRPVNRKYFVCPITFLFLFVLNPFT